MIAYDILVIKKLNPNEKNIDNIIYSYYKDMSFLREEWKNLVSDKELYHALKECYSTFIHKEFLATATLSNNIIEYIIRKKAMENIDELPPDIQRKSKNNNK